MTAVLVCGTLWILDGLRPHAKLDLGAGWSPRGTVCMTHRRVAMLFTTPISCCLAGRYLRQRLRKGNTEIK